MTQLLPAPNALSAHLLTLEKARADVLVIDDEASVRQVLSASLASRHYTFATACDGREAVALLARQRFRLIVTDIFMPRMDGLELIRHCRAVDPEMLILTCSGGGQYSQEETALRSASLFGSARILTKPFTVVQFLTMVHEMIGTKVGHGEAAERANSS